MKKDRQYALITGATSGIGLELAKLFAKNDYNLVIVARDEAELDQTSNMLTQEYKVEVTKIAKDLFNVDAALALYDLVKAKGIVIDVLVNDAGQGAYGEFVENDLKRELDIIQLNICSVVILTKQFLREMVARKSGRILNVASIAGKLPGPLQAVYHATKAFVHSFTIAIGEEVKDSGVVVTSLLPGVTDTDFFRKAHMEESKIVQEGSMADPADVAKDGYEALMKGESMVVSGLKNKMQVAMGNITSDRKVAEKMHEEQKPVDKDKEKNKGKDTDKRKAA